MLSSLSLEVTIWRLIFVTVASLCSTAQTKTAAPLAQCRGELVKAVNIRNEALQSTAATESARAKLEAESNWGVAVGGAGYIKLMEHGDRTAGAAHSTESEILFLNQFISSKISIAARFPEWAPPSINP